MKKTKKYYWFKTNGKVEEISEGAFNFLVEENFDSEKKNHTLVLVVDGMIRFCWGNESVWIKKSQLEQVMAQ